MNLNFSSSKRARAGGALVLTMIMLGIALAILASAMTWSANSTRMTHRSIQHTRTVAAAEAATEKVVSQITRDFLHGGERLVVQNLSTYRQTVPSSSDSSFWNQWEFNDAAGNNSRTHVKNGLSSNYVVFNSSYAGLRGYVSTYSVVSHAREAAALQNVVAGVLQEVQLARIPVFQFAMYSSADMEISCGQPLSINGQVHANKMLYVEPASDLTFKSDVTAVTDIVFARHPLDTRSPPSGTVVYQVPKKSPVAATTLPIGFTNSPEAIREIIAPPPFGEDPNSPVARLRYHNLSDMILEVSDAGVSAKSVKYSGSWISIPTNELYQFVSTTNSFRDAREEKTVRPIDIDVGALATWSESNTDLKTALGGRTLSSIYVLDLRALAGTELGAVRVHNGLRLPESGLTVSTARPLYVLGDYNQTNTANLGTTNTTTTLPASLAADAVTILSTNWADTNSTRAVNSRPAAPTTVNAALLTGVVETTFGNYSGGMENFPRFLERWGAANIFTYNGSMVKMFPSLYATNRWGKSDVYDPPRRNWSFDFNFYEPARLPPLTPSLVKVFRTRWDTVAPDANVSVATASP